VKPSLCLTPISCAKNVPGELISTPLLCLSQLFTSKPSCSRRGKGTGVCAIIPVYRYCNRSPKSGAGKSALINAVFGVDATVSALSCCGHLYFYLSPSLTGILMTSIRSSASRKIIVSSSTTPEDSRQGRKQTYRKSWTLLSVDPRCQRLVTDYT
jgi:hypothetical protein